MNESFWQEEGFPTILWQPKISGDCFVAMMPLVKKCAIDPELKIMSADSEEDITNASCCRTLTGFCLAKRSLHSLAELWLRRSLSWKLKSATVPAVYVDGISNTACCDDIIDVALTRDTDGTIVVKLYRSLITIVDVHINHSKIITLSGQAADIQSTSWVAFFNTKPGHHC